MCIAVNPQLAVEGHTTGLHRRGAGLDQTIATSCNLLDPLLIAFRGATIALALLIGQWCQHESVSHRWAMQKRERFE